ncbi:MAG TPA: hypothetical protein VFQ53_34070 [Kofleriaceae bacterium]|nr:hypothetical protein [Kofleriaceae bacterium]
MPASILVKPDDPTLEPFVSGVLRRFGADLHEEDPQFAYRALVDFAHDACMRRAHREPDYAPAILVGTQMLGGVAHVSVADNGEPVAAESVRQLYATIRSGRSGAVRRALVAGGRDGAEAIVGALGDALLAAFLIADQVTIATRATEQPPDAGARYTCNSRTYTTTACRMARPGTIIQLRIRSEHRPLATVDAVRDALVEHARTLALPVRVGSDPTPINAASLGAR